MRRRGGLQSCENRRGFTVVELMVAFTLGLIVLTGVYKLLVSQSRLYGVQREVMDTRQSLRSTAALLSWELWGASANGGDLYEIGLHSLALRSLGDGRRLRRGQHCRPSGVVADLGGV